MTETDEQLSVHSRKFYKVVLEAIDDENETMESFAIKLSMRLRVPFPRIRQVLRQLPCTVKSHVTAAQANRLKAMIEEVGGRVRLETHFATPGSREDAPEDLRDDAGGAKDEGKIQCPACGWESDEGAQFCSMCLRRFRDTRQRRDSLGTEIPHDNPLDEQSFRRSAGAEPSPSPAFDPVAFWGRYKLPILIGGAVLLLLVILLK
ncbi:MAG: hypothetical protein ACE5EO_08575 [Candidatus Krumholzibacteriia bacterium]